LRKDSSVGSKAVRDESMASYSDGMVLPKTKKDLAGTLHVHSFFYGSQSLDFVSSLIFSFMDIGLRLHFFFFIFF